MPDISRFVNEETILVNDPVFSREAIQEYVMHPQKKLNKHKKIGNFATHSTKEVFTICLLCEGKHNLDDHKSFKENDLQERSRFLFEQKLCYGCLSPTSSSHNTRNSKISKEWKVWKKMHPTSLHGFFLFSSFPKENLKREKKDNE